MINYIFTIVELDAEQMQAPQDTFEHEDDFMARMRAARGKNFLRILVQDGADKQMQFESPYFDKASDEQRYSTLARGMKEAKRVIIGRDRMKRKEVLAKN